MKNLLIILTAVFLIVNTFLPWQASAQSPEKMKYQAVIRDSNGHVVTNQAIGMQISILQGDLPGTVVYTETQSLLSNTLGLTSTEIGTGTVVLGDFSTIDWANGPYFLQIETDPTGGTNYTVTGTNQLLSVPFAMHAKTADSLTDIDSFSWSTTGNIGTDPANNFIGTTDNQPLIFKVNNIQAGKIPFLGNNTFYGLETGLSPSGLNNSAFGYQAQYNNGGNNNTAMGYKALYSNINGGSNTAIGLNALLSNISGNENTAIGTGALALNTGSSNSALGYAALSSNTIGTNNCAVGKEALNNNTTGNNNTAMGNKALSINEAGQRNTAIGSGSLQENETGNDNTAIGFGALLNSWNGNDNTAIGRGALFTTWQAHANTAVGKSAMYYNWNGHGNTAIGYQALVNNPSGVNNTAIGYQALLNTIGDYNPTTTGSNNTAVGYWALSDVTTGNFNIGIGYNAQVPNGTSSHQVRMGNTSVLYAGIQVGWSITSDKIWKEQIRDLPYGLDMLMKLKPVDYYRKNSERKTREMGFIAQDVEVLLNEMGYDDQGLLTKADNGNLSLRYNDFIALLTNAVKEQQQIIEQQADEIKAQNDNYEKLIKRIEELEKSKNQ